MARSRNIKPAFFTNDELSEIEPLGRLLFIGLWTLADYKGDLEWRAKRIKAQILPYDNCDVEKLAINLDKSGFVRFYSDDNAKYIHITNFAKHQNPHKNEREKGSEIPAFCETMRETRENSRVEINRDKSGLKREDSETNPADSLNLIPDSLNLIPSNSSETCEPIASPADDCQVVFDYWVLVMGKQPNQTKLTAKRKKAIKARLKEYSLETVKQAIDGCRADPFYMGANDRQTPFNDIELICRSGEKLESFLQEKVFVQQPQKMTAIDQAFQTAIEPDPLEGFIGEQQKLIN